MRASLIHAARCCGPLQAMTTATQIARSTGAKKLSCVVIDDSAVIASSVPDFSAEAPARASLPKLACVAPRTQTPTTAERHKAITFVFEEVTTRDLLLQARVACV